MFSKRDLSFSLLKFNCHSMIALSSWATSIELVVGRSTAASLGNYKFEMTVKLIISSGTVLRHRLPVPVNRMFDRVARTTRY
jgi:hypothetical protein